jgi:hypothetical protein
MARLVRMARERASRRDGRGDAECEGCDEDEGNETCDAGE